MPPHPDLAQLLQTACDGFLAHDADMIRKRAHEQSITETLASYLRPALTGWHLNCEYNRQGEDGDPKRDARGRLRRPDIIVHRRGHDRDNLLVVEMKPAWEGMETIDVDRQKLRAMLAPPRSYCYAFLITYTDAPEPAFTIERVT